MNKKLLSLALAGALGLSLTACGGTASTPSTNPSSAPSGAQESAAPSENQESDLQYVKDKGTLVVGITNFEPMDYQDADGNWIGFDADMAKAFAESLGVTAEFVEINWDYKVMELDAKNIDCVWNGMTINDEVKAAMSVSNPYCLNAQVLVVPADKAEDFDSVDALEGLTVAVESGSAGEDAAQALGLSTVPVQKQADTLMEVAAGTSDAAVIDLLMAGAMIGEGTSYADLTYTLNLNEAQGLESEEYGVGFRAGSDLTEAYNDFWAGCVADGSALETATTYGVQESVILE
ncbi:MAG TPA: transporter substrate-binding domain-containing protein [Candidatus Flavonifractor merdigallinarum]|uniref:Transporter substrate-binding domain-containing protein n=1 Tax=Candidatus Flavonifractor merdigallinarum TaxID=2838589 RepID=A0A9D1YCC2_9FIRM|nr:transporter substrate-binding domain-containing protein [Candidatus Flavonifractor merdigallinarum]